MQKLEQECRVFTRYLSGSDPTGYVIDKYVQFNNELGASIISTNFDKFLINTAARGIVWTALADSYSRFFRKTGALRKKLILVVALLECAPPSFEALDSVPSGGPAGAILRLAGISVKFVAALIAGTLVFAPARILISTQDR